MHADEPFIHWTIQALLSADVPLKQQFSEARCVERPRCRALSHSFFVQLWEKHRLLITMVKVILVISTGHSGPQLGASGRLYQQSSVSGMIGYLSVQQAAGTQVCLQVPEAFMMPLQPQA